MSFGSWRDHFAEEEIVEALRELVRLDTSNPPGNERQAAEVLCDIAAKLGLDAERVPLGDRRANAVIRLRGRRRDTALLFNGHLDTVPPGEAEWTFGPHSADLVDGRLYGRGASDMKGGLISMLYAMGLLRQEGIVPAGDIILAATAGEEVDSLGARSFARDGGLEKVAAAVIAEPTGMDVVVAEKGVLWLELESRGKTAHGSRPDLGVNAITGMMEVLVKLQGYQFTSDPHPHLTPPTLNIGTIRGGVKTNVVPDRCVATVDLRTVPGMDHGMLLEDFRALTSGADVSIEVLNDRPPVETPQDHPLVVAAVESGREVFGKRPVVRGAAYYTDASVFAPEGIPFVIVGPGLEEMAHQPDEYVSVASVLEAIDYYAHLAMRFLGT